MGRRGEKAAKYRLSYGTASRSLNCYTFSAVSIFLVYLPTRTPEIIKRWTVRLLWTVN
jgi:hypothetical protein